MTAFLKAIKIIILLVILIGAPFSLYALIFIPGNGINNNESFLSPVKTAVFDPPTRTWFVGLDSGAGTYALSKISHILNREPLLQFVPLAPATAATTNQSIEFLSIATAYASSYPLLAVVLENGTPFLQNTVTISSTDGTKVNSSDTLNDFAGATTEGIVALAASDKFIFAAVRPVSGDFPDTDSGVALVSIEHPALTLETTDATTGIAGNKAQQLDINASYVQISTPPTFTANGASMTWDNRLERLYIGLQLQTAAGAGDGAKSVVMGYVTPSRVLTLTDFLPTAALNNGDTDKIAAVQSAGTSLNSDAFKLHTLHTSTGASYLIIHGGSFDPASIDSVTNTIYALPLVDLGDPTNPTQGVLANKNSFNATTGRFETAAAANADLTSNTDAAAVVGGGPLPIDTNHTISHIQVAQDTVYVSMSHAPDAANDTGIFYSQALFDQQGKISRWSPWTKRLIPLTAFDDNTVQGVSFFSVDPAQSTVFAVDALTKKNVRTSTWQLSSNKNSLIFNLNEELKRGCCSVLDLDQSTRGFFGTNAPQNRYTLFGGSNKVVFARTSQATVANPPINAPQTTITDFSSGNNIRATYLPGHAGAVTSLAYTRQVPGTATNYFFAGTDQGLYAFDADGAGNGFDATTLSTVSTAPFSTGQWHKINAISGAVVDIKTAGNRLYVLARNPSSSHPLNTVVYSMPITSPLAAMFAAPEIIAQSSTAPIFTPTNQFYQMGIISTNNAGSTEQLVLATNTGLYRSSRAGGVQQAGTTQTTAGWTIIDDQWYIKVFGLDTISPSTIGLGTITNNSTLWPITLTDSNKQGTYQNSTITQLAGTADAGPFSFVPSSFDSSQTDEDIFTNLSRINYFWTDGARRLFISSFLQGRTPKNVLLSLPFDTQLNNAQLHTGTPMVHQILNEFSRFYWISPIGSTGLLLVGTDKGVVALQ